MTALLHDIPAAPAPWWEDAEDDGDWRLDAALAAVPWDMPRSSGAAMEGRL